MKIDNSTMNRIHNSSNKFQGVYKRVLCICSAGLLRSPTASNILHRTYGYNTRCAGWSSDFALIFADEVLLAWADEYVVFDTKTENELKDLTCTEGKRIVNLNIKDEYCYMDTELQELILLRYTSEVSSS